ncbi:MAG: 4-vinyl reductase [Candidatus Micrarchaeota archaeon]|nr:4-vinyl reductase [Candidatus Micrarchaeota archaeon]MDE1849099.1 4-vinyl reductase [Candidatus Micrarchaeota archaeon]
MNIFERFLLSREVTVREGEITLDQQRVIMLPVNFIASYTLKLANDKAEGRKLYEAMKKGMFAFSIPLGKAYGLSYKDFLDRWIKYNAFAGWGIVEYQLIETDTTRGFLTYKNLTLHLYLKGKGITEHSDRLLEGIIAGALSSTFKVDIDAVETKCVCSGNDVCVFYWGPRSYLRKEFPELISKW